MTMFEFFKDDTVVSRPDVEALRRIYHDDQDILALTQWIEHLEACLQRLADHTYLASDANTYLARAALKGEKEWLK